MLYLVLNPETFCPVLSCPETKIVWLLKSLNILLHQENVESVLKTTTKKSQNGNRKCKIFEGKLRPLFRVDNHNSNRSIVSVSKIENGLVELNNLLSNKASPQDLMKIVHTQIHPSLQLGPSFRVKIK